MLKIRFQGIADGKHLIALECAAAEVPYLQPEFYGNITVSGTLTKSQRRYSFAGSASCKANLLCDITAEEFNEEVSTELKLVFVVDNALYFIQQNELVDSDTEIALHEDEAFYDISAIVKDELALSLPMRRIAPAHRQQSFADIHPEYTTGSDAASTDDRWAALKDLQLP